MKTIILIHFQPLEKYPPITNIITDLINSIDSEKILVLTNNCPTIQKKFSSNCPNVNINRLSEVCPNKPKLVRLWNYIKFYIQACRIAWKVEPKKIVYFETLSALPALLYHTFFPCTEIGVHFHEYSSPNVYKKGMRLEILIHKLEKLKFPHFTWISQTNQFRLTLFLKDHKTIQKAVARIMPNYPPKNWINNKRTKVLRPVKVVYIGALSKENMYLEEFCKWLSSHNGEITLDIYSNNTKSSAIQFIEDLNSPYITFRGDTHYYDIPNVLEEYSVGVILYKGNSENHEYCVPNKLFEYYTCGLDVWIPDTIIASIPYVTDGTYPKITALDFNRLHNIDIYELLNRENAIHKPNTFYAEEGITEFRHFILN